MNKKQELIDAINYWREQNEIYSVPGANIKVDILREELRQLKGLSKTKEIKKTKKAKAFRWMSVMEDK